MQEFFNLKAKKLLFLLDDDKYFDTNIVFENEIEIPKQFFDMRFSGRIFKYFVEQS